MDYLKRRYQMRKQYLFKKAVLERDKNTCQDCGSKELVEAHHKLPIGKGGTWDLLNGVALCERCHLKRHRKKIRQKLSKTKEPLYYHKVYFSESFIQPMVEFIKLDMQNCSCKRSPKNWKRHIFHMLIRLMELENTYSKYEELCEKYRID